MKNQIILIVLTIVTLLVATIMIIFIDAQHLSAYGSILAASGSFIAVIWFMGSLRYQAQQLKEQREQFQKEFDRSNEESRRNALLLAKEILLTAEKRALAVNSDLSSVEQIYHNYIDLIELKDILKSSDPKVVQASLSLWHKRETPAIELLKGIKSAAQVYFIAINKLDIDYTAAPEDFVSEYGQDLWSLPFFSAYQACAMSLAEFMITLKPSRKAVHFATLGVMVTLTSKNVLKMDKIKEDIAEYEAKGRKIPVIAEILRDKTNQ
ncbi:hypothetical protein [Photobacterium angustum]|uniref:hypothetical protein n=1 Tax=Photobacterium angustum TaxID=661 RepID=UPI0011B2294E|nr:hypothetical protein [Photobacterium angustum]